jgi:hypothetical protein
MSKLTRNQKMKSSDKARRLIARYVKRYGTEHAAAEHLHMTQAALNKMRRGLLRDTPAMKIALARAQRRAERAYWRIDEEAPQRWIDEVETLRAARRTLEQTLRMIDAILKQRDRK